MRGDPETGLTFPLYKLQEVEITDLKCGQDLYCME